MVEGSFLFISTTERGCSMVDEEKKSCFFNDLDNQVITPLEKGVGELDDLKALEGGDKYRDGLVIKNLLAEELGFFGYKESQYGKKPYRLLYEVISDTQKDGMRARASLSYNGEFRLTSAWELADISSCAQTLLKQTENLKNLMKREVLELCCLT